MNFSSEQIDQIIQGFESTQLPKEQWTHSAHLIIALWYCTTYDNTIVMNLLRNNITKYNEQVGTPNTESEGYHETITRFWFWQTQQFLRTHQNLDFTTACNEYIHSAYGQKSAPLNYYSKELLFSTKARMSYVKPDLREMK